VYLKIIKFQKNVKLIQKQFKERVILTAFLSNASLMYLKIIKLLTTCRA